MLPSHADRISDPVLDLQAQPAKIQEIVYMPANAWLTAKVSTISEYPSVNKTI